jgi:hypothetical protein
MIKISFKIFYKTASFFIMSSLLFDRSALRIKHLHERIHDLDRSVVLGLSNPASSKVREENSSIARNIISAREQGR